MTKQLLYEDKQSVPEPEERACLIYRRLPSSDKENIKTVITRERDRDAKGILFLLIEATLATVTIVFAAKYLVVKWIVFRSPPNNMGTYWDAK